jgi:hypothetical protein
MFHLCKTIINSFLHLMKLLDDEILLIEILLSYFTIMYIDLTNQNVKTFLQVLERRLIRDKRNLCDSQNHVVCWKSDSIKFIIHFDVICKDLK